MVNKDSSNVSFQILDVLRRSKDGLSINEISQKIGIYRSTTSKYLLALQKEGIIKSKKVGPAKLYFLSSKDSVERNIEEIQEDKEWIDSLILEIKEEIKEELLKEGIR